MSSFSSDWLALREPADHQARRHELLERLSRPADDAPWRIIDLGSGTGSNLRYLLPRLAGQQRWTLVDNDPGLLTDLPARLAPWAAAQALELRADDGALQIDGERVSARIRTQSLDLAGDLDALDLRKADLVSCSALLDLFSQERLHALADVIARARCQALFTLSYDGRVRWSPKLSFDDRATQFLNAHQRRDKGLGGAAGPDAAASMVSALRARGYQVAAEPADWRLDSSRAPLQTALLDGWADALCEQRPEATTDVRAWQARRRSLIDRGEGTLQVGHLDIVATPG